MVPTYFDPLFYAIFVPASLWAMYLASKRLGVAMTTGLTIGAGLLEFWIDFDSLGPFHQELRLATALDAIMLAGIVIALVLVVDAALKFCKLL